MIPEDEAPQQVVKPVVKQLDQQQKSQDVKQKEEDQDQQEE